MVFVYPRQQYQPNKMENSSERPTDMSREKLIQELEDTREQLKKQKTLKEMYINRGKETTRELERLRKYSDDATLSSAKIATQVRDNTRQKKKKDLHKDYEELKVAHLINEEKYQADLQAEKDKNSLLQKELDQISISYNELKVRYVLYIAYIMCTYNSYSVVCLSLY